MQIRDRIVELRRVRGADLLPDPRNWRRHSKQQTDALEGILREIGYAGALLARETPDGLMLIDGHLRASVTRDALVPVLVLDVNEAEAATILATYDPLGAMAEADAQALDALLRDVSTGEAAVQQMLADLAEAEGLDYGAEEKPDAPEAEVDRAAELQAKWKVKPGDLWLIGRHRLLCGDSTNADDVDRLMQGERAVLLATDPPYNVGKDYGEEVDDALVEGDYETFSRSWFGWWQAASERQIVTPGCYNLARWCRYFEPYHVAPWTKSNGMTNGKVARFWCWEPMLFFGDKWPRKRPNDIFDFPVGQQAEVANHPCPKPLKMWVDLLDHYSEAGDIVADAFDGSGTTLVAAEQTGRVGRAMELEPKYVAVALERLSNLGLTPRLADAQPARA